MVKHGALCLRSRRHPASADWTRHHHRRRQHHAVVGQAQRRRIGDQRSLPHRNPREVVVLKVQRSGAAAAHALNVHLRHAPNKLVIIQEQALHAIKHGGELSAQSVMAQIDYRSGLGSESRSR